MASLQQMPNELQMAIFCYLDRPTLESLTHLVYFTPIVTDLLLAIDPETSRFYSRVLLWGASHNNRYMIERYVYKHGRGGLDNPGSIDYMNATGTALHAAAGAGHSQMVAMLLDLGAEIDAQACFRGSIVTGDRFNYVRWTWEVFTPLAVALARGHASTAALLVERGATLEQCTPNMVSRQTNWRCRFHAAHAAAFGGCHDMMKKLLKDADLGPDYVDARRRTTLHWACMSSAGARYVEQLVRLGADVNARDEDNQTALQKAAAYIDNFAVARAAMMTLLGAGADINAMDNNVMTPLAEAAGWLSEWRIHFMLDHGARPRPLDASGHSNMPMIQLLATCWVRCLYKDPTKTNAVVAEKCARMLLEADDSGMAAEALADRKQLLQRSLLINLAGIAELLRLKGIGHMSSEEKLVLLESIVLAAWEPNTSLPFLLMHYVPERASKDEATKLFFNMLGSRAIRCPSLSRIMRSAVQMPQLQLGLLLVATVKNPHYQHPESTYLLELLLSNYRDINMTDNQGKTLAHHLVYNGFRSFERHVDDFPTVLNWLVRRRLDLNVADINKRTPLHHLAKKGGRTSPVFMARRARLMIDLGADATLSDSDGRRPIDAYEKRRPDWRTEASSRPVGMVLWLAVSRAVSV